MEPGVNPALDQEWQSRLELAASLAIKTLPSELLDDA
jgi:hypothetical protein